jgi:hypothetical protein
MEWSEVFGNVLHLAGPRSATIEVIDKTPFFSCSTQIRGLVAAWGHYPGPILLIPRGLMMSQRKRSAAFRAQRTNRSHACFRSAADHRPRTMMCQDEFFPGVAASLRKDRNTVPGEYFSSVGVLNCGPELETFRAHLKICPTCQRRLEEGRAFSRVFHRSRPLYQAPEQLRSQVSEILMQHPAAGNAERIYLRLLRILQWPFPNCWPYLLSWGVLVTALMVVALFLSFVPGVVRRVHAASYVETAMAVHRSYLEGSLDPQIQSDSPTLVSAWFAGKVPFDFRLPAARDSNPVYRLASARLVSYRGHDAALVIYETQREKISLLVASNKYAAIAGGDEVLAGSLVFHYFSRNKFKVITWSNHGLSYALVSSLSASARESCLVCHQSMADRDVFRTRP